MDPATISTIMTAAQKAGGLLQKAALWLFPEPPSVLKYKTIVPEIVPMMQQMRQLPRRGLTEYYWEKTKDPFALRLGRTVMSGIGGVLQYGTPIWDVVKNLKPTTDTTTTTDVGKKDEATTDMGQTNTGVTPPLETTQKDFGLRLNKLLEKIRPQKEQQQQQQFAITQDMNKFSDLYSDPRFIEFLRSYYPAYYQELLREKDIFVPKRQISRWENLPPKGV